MVGAFFATFFGVLDTACAIQVQKSTSGPEWLGPVIAAAVGALAAISAALLATRASLRTSAHLLLEKHETLKRDTICELLALTGQPQTPDNVAKITATISRLKLLITPKRRVSKELLTHLESVFAKPDNSVWREQLLALARQELEHPSN
jgi:hypothetical protein